MCTGDVLLVVIRFGQIAPRQLFTGSFVMFSRSSKAYTLALLASAITPRHVFGQAPSSPPSVPIAATERRVLTSKINGTEYLVDVALPDGYCGSTKRYPVFY